MKYIFLALLTISLIAHIGTFIPGVRESMDWTWPLHVAVVLLFVVLAFQAQKLAPSVFRPQSILTLRMDPSVRMSLQSVPRVMKAMFALTMVYFILIFVATFFTFPGGTVEDIGGQHRLVSHGQIIRLLPQSEYTGFQNHLVRSFSALWIYFSLAGFIGAAYILPAMKLYKEANEN